MGIVRDTWRAVLVLVVGVLLLEAAGLVGDALQLGRVVIPKDVAVLLQRPLFTVQRLKEGSYFNV